MKYSYEIHLEGEPEIVDRLLHSDVEYKVGDIVTPYLASPERKMVIVKRTQMNRMNHNKEFVTARLECNYK